MSKAFSVIICIVAFIFLVVLPVFFGATPTGKAMWNNWFHTVQKVDDATNYKTKKAVEDTCRSMIATYENDKTEYESNMAMFEETKDEYYREVANGYRQQANSTAAEYNNYILKNSYVFSGNVPSDIFGSLEMIK